MGGGRLEWEGRIRITGRSTAPEPERLEKVGAFLIQVTRGEWGYAGRTPDLNRRTSRRYSLKKCRPVVLRVPLHQNERASVALPPSHRPADVG